MSYLAKSVEDSLHVLFQSHFLLPNSDEDNAHFMFFFLFHHVNFLVLLRMKFAVLICNDLCSLILHDNGVQRFW